MRHPWNALTELLAAPVDPDEGVGVGLFAAAAREAWTETASRMGLVRLGWRPVGREADFDLAYPCERALIKAEARRPRGGPILSSPGPGLEEEIRIELASGTLVAAAPRGDLPPRRALNEVAALAAGQHARKELGQRLAGAGAVARQGRQAAAAAHDLRNELTRALLHAARGKEGDAAEVVGALAAARELAQTALHTDPGLSAAARPEHVSLRALLVEESGAASASARVPAGAGPRLRVRCARDLVVLAEPSALGRAVRNLITNALESAARGRNRPGSVDVIAERASATPAGFDVRIRVADDGVGLNSGALRRILEPGPALTNDALASDHGKPESTGLGTASLRVALETLGSPFRMTSCPGDGATAEISLRGAPVQPPVLVIDPDVRRGLRRVRALEREHGETGWVLARTAAAHALASPDLIARIECVAALGDVEGRSALQRICKRQRVALVWRSTPERAIAGR